MMDNIHIFVKVVQAGSFTAAAKALQMPITTVSSKVAYLEKELKATLLQRTTRKIGLTEAGEIVFRRGLKSLEEIESIKNELAPSESEASGLLRVTAPADFAHGFMLPAIKSYLDAHPKVQIEMILTNKIVNLISEGIDLGIRIGDLKDSTMIARKYFTSTGGVYATPAYLKKNPKINSLSDLTNHNVIQYTRLAGKQKFSNGKETQVLTLTGRFLADEMVTLKAMTLANSGIGLIPDHNCVEEVERGDLVRLFPKWTWVKINVSFVYPSQKYVPVKVKTFIEWMTKNSLYG